MSSQPIAGPIGGCVRACRHAKRPQNGPPSTRSEARRVTSIKILTHIKWRPIFLN